MSCQKYENQIPDYAKGRLAAKAELEEHLKECDRCAEKLNHVVQAQDLFRQWKDESVPPWYRAPAGFFNEKRTSWIWTWSPMVLACVLLAFTILNLEIQINENGTTIRFSEVPNQSEIQRKFIAKMEERNRENQEVLKSILTQFQADHQEDVKMLINEAMDSNRAAFSKNMALMNDSWQSQRQRDQVRLNKQLQSVYEYTATNNQNLNLLANQLVRFK
ncbi:MAG: hypothetical protein CSA81_08205 [Acidobacteria bacterium]|nr:MAG: hypothetical protein CSA81_08205 [Acidobacteriota bacterium]PIE89707.1 MAG: hypothetical protein CR997_09740 [Acidobacteriota bacterium]